MSIKKAVVIVVVMVILGGVAWWGLQQRGAVPVPATQTISVDTSGWKTYRNEQYGFEFRYPDGWFDVITMGDGFLELDKRFRPAKSNQNPEDMSGFCILHFDTFEKSPQETLSDSLGIKDGAEFLTIDSHEGLRILLEEGLVSDFVYLLLSNTNVLSVRFACGDNVRSEGTTEFNTILSTFKFTQ